MSILVFLFFMEMIIYNVTVTIAPEIRENWLDWMCKVHVPEVVKLGNFLSANIMRVITEDEQEFTYAIQYSCGDMEVLQTYMKAHASLMQQQHNEMFRDKFFAFRTVLQQIHHEVNNGK